MTLQELIKLKQGATFKFRGALATVVWTEFQLEPLGKKKIKVGNVEKEIDIFMKDFGFCFHALDFNYTLRSNFPDPEKLELEEFTQ